MPAIIKDMRHRYYWGRKTIKRNLPIIGASVNSGCYYTSTENVFCPASPNQVFNSLYFALTFCEKTINCSLNSTVCRPKLI